MRVNIEDGECSESEGSETDSSENQNGTYFSSYENLDVHRLMLEDHSRTEAYRKSIIENRSLFEGKLVMDVGAGTGILSLFAAQAGAKKVYAIEASSVALLARKIVKRNELESVIEVFSCEVEDFILPDAEKVDILISEWMGFYLVHESMLSSVIFARDKFLKESGLMFPCKACIYACPSNLQDFYAKEIHFWDNVYGYDFSVVKQLALQSKLNSPQIMLMNSNELLCEAELLKDFDLMRISLEDIKTFRTKFFVSSANEGVCRGVVLWFDCTFPTVNQDSKGTILSTAPDNLPTHWKQTVIVLPAEISMDEGDIIGFGIEFVQSIENQRHYNIKVEVLGDDVEHPVPCNCGCARCKLVKAFLEEQHDKDLDEAENIVDISL